MSELSSPQQLQGTLSTPEQIRGVLSGVGTLSARLRAGQLGPGIYIDTTANWNANVQLIGARGSLYIYTDHSTYTLDGQTVNVPSIRIGDGTTYLIDLPFITDQSAYAIIEHAANSDIHVTQQEKDFWNNKVTSYTNPDDPEELILTKM